MDVVNDMIAPQEPFFKREMHQYPLETNYLQIGGNIAEQKHLQQYQLLILSCQGN